MVVVLTGLSELGVNTAPLLASASIFGVALGFGSQKLVQDFITGIFLLMENARPVGRLGDGGERVGHGQISVDPHGPFARRRWLAFIRMPFSSVSTVNNTNRGIGNATGARVDRAGGRTSISPFRR